MGDERCTVLINSCDAFSDVWDLFFTALRINWKECDYPIILNTESKEYSHDPNIKVIHYNPLIGKHCWGKQLKNALNSISTPYVMPLLEDFVLTEEFKGDELIRNAIKWMDDNPDIGVFYLHKHPNVIQQETEFAGFGIMPQECEYKLTTQPGVWRKSYLDKCLKGIENPWEWEIYVSKHAGKLKEREYALLNTQKEVFVIPSGGVIQRGRWIPEAVKLAEKYGVEIDFGIRGMRDEADPYRTKEKGTKYAFFKRCKNKLLTL